MSFAASAGVVGDARAGIAERAEILGREERQAADVADGAGAPALRVLRADGLRRIFDDAQAVAPRDRHDARHVGHLAVQVHRHERAHAAAGGAIDQHAVARLAARR